MGHSTTESTRPHRIYTHNITYTCCHYLGGWRRFIEYLSGLNPENPGVITHALTHSNTHAHATARARVYAQQCLGCRLPEPPLPVLLLSLYYIYVHFLSVCIYYTRVRIGINFFPQSRRAFRNVSFSFYSIISMQRAFPRRMPPRVLGNTTAALPLYHCVLLYAIWLPFVLCVYIWR